MRCFRRQRHASMRTGVYELPYWSFERGFRTLTRFPLRSTRGSSNSLSSRSMIRFSIADAAFGSFVCRLRLSITASSEALISKRSLILGMPFSPRLSTRNPDAIVRIRVTVLFSTSRHCGGVIVRSQDEVEIRNLRPFWTHKRGLSAPRIRETAPLPSKPCTQPQMP